MVDYWKLQQAERAMAKPHKQIAREHVDAAILSMRAAIVNLELAKGYTVGTERRAWLENAIALATDAIGDAAGSLGKDGE